MRFPCTCHTWLTITKHYTHKYIKYTTIISVGKQRKILTLHQYQYITHRTHTIHSCHKLVHPRYQIIIIFWSGCAFSYLLFVWFILNFLFCVRVCPPTLWNATRFSSAFSYLSSASSFFYFQFLNACTLSGVTLWSGLHIFFSFFERARARWFMLHIFTEQCFGGDHHHVLRKVL